MKNVLAFLVLLFFGTVQAQYTNVPLDLGNGRGYPPCEPSIAISPKNPKYMVAGAILDKVYSSKDCGKTWETARLESSHGVYGDPCIVADQDGGFYYLHLSDPSGKGWMDSSLLDRIVCQYSKNKGKTWTDGQGIGLNGEKDQDKEWAAINRQNGSIYVTWTQFDLYNSKADQDSTVILFSKSTGKDAPFSEPVRINQIAGNCLDDDETVEGAVPATGTDGEIYVAWAYDENIYFDRSTDDGETWLEKDIIAGEIIGGWNQEVPGVGRCNGMPVTMVDHSDGEYRGNIYINYTDQRNGSDDTDVWIIKSSDQGNTWSDPIRVNDDAPGKHQFFTWMAIDDSSGHIYVVFYDRRNHDGNMTDVYLATSTDGGKTFTNELISESAFDPTGCPFFGDYNNISAQDGHVRPIWTRYEDRKTSIWTAIIDK